jgi:hypothetical protein
MPDEEPKGTRNTQVTVALISAGAVVIAALIGLAASRGGSSGSSGGGGSSPSATPAASNSSVPGTSTGSLTTPTRTATTASQPSKQQTTTVTYTVDPTKWAPAAVPGLTLTRGDVVRIQAISGHWVCATVAGPAAVQGNTKYVATYHPWAVPSAPFCSLIGKIGNGPWEEMGEHLTFVANRSGPLALTVNELMPNNCPQPPSDTSCYTDNSGAIKILITIT